ncbi:MAG: type II toxin-antitoxin system RelE/ParE family toxin [Methylotenera sp.]|nr:type II toxin-antitoxin system RelE/ParE family toxin [Methylotenera sp.]
MTKLEYSNAAMADIERVVNFLMDVDLVAALDIFDIIDDGLHLLKRHPEVGRLVGACMRELVISRGNTGYIAIYEFDRLVNVVVVLAIKHQREDQFR